MLDIFLKKFWKYRKAFGLSYFFFGLPITYFLRDGIKLAPGNSTFTAVLTLGPLLLVLPKNMFKSLYVPNVLAYWLSFIFLGLSLLYIIFYCPNAGWFTNQYTSSIFIFLIASIYLLLTTISVQELRNTFVLVTFIITVIGCLGVVYIMLRNPLYFVGMKAGISLGSEDQATTNSHVFGKGGFAAAMSGIILLKRYKFGIKKLIVMGGTFLGFMILISAQSMSSILAFGVALALYANSHLHIPTALYKTYRLFWNYRFLLAFIILGYGWYRIYNQYSFFKDTFEVVTGRLDRIVNTVFLGETKGIRTVDYSARDRLGHIMLVFEGLDENLEKGNFLPIIFGNGYEVLYVDSPVLQSFNDFGLFGFTIYVSMLFVLIRSMFLVLKDTNNDFTNFICYVFCLILVQNFTAGMVIDYPKWSYFALIARFALPHIHDIRPTSFNTTHESNYYS